MAVGPETLRLLRGLRVDIAATVDDTTSTLVRAWARAWQELSTVRIAALSDLIAGSADGRWPTRAVIMRAEQTLKALHATRQALLDLADNAGVRILQVLPDITTEAAQ